MGHNKKKYRRFDVSTRQKSTRRLLRAVATQQWDNACAAVMEGAEVAERNNYALRQAAMCGEAKALKCFLEHGADVQAQNGTPIRYAADKGHVETTRLLLAYGADPHVLDDLPLKTAALWGHTEIVDLLLGHNGFSQDSVDTALKWAVRNDQDETARYLRAHGAQMPEEPSGKGFDRYDTWKSRPA